MTAIILATIACGLRSFRSSHPVPRYVPTAFLKRLWSDWRVPPRPASYHQTTEDDSTDGGSRLRPSRARQGSPTVERGPAPHRRGAGVGKILSRTHILVTRTED